MKLKRCHIIMLLLLLTACGDTAYHGQLKFLYSHSVPTISADSLFRLLEESGSPEPDSGDAGFVKSGAGKSDSRAPVAGTPVAGKPVNFILLDTRDRHEWQLSHIPHAQWAGFENFTLNLPHIPDKETPVVLYCTIGYRSEQIGEQLVEAGFSNVSHLYGGIIEWKNNSYPIHTYNARVTDSVHTYDRYWGMFLKEGIPIYE